MHCSPSFPPPPSSSALLQPFPSCEGRALTLSPLPQPCRNEPLPSKNLSFPHRGGEGDLIRPLFVGCFPLAAAPQRLTGRRPPSWAPPEPLPQPPAIPPSAAAHWLRAGGNGSRWLANLHRSPAQWGKATRPAFLPIGFPATCAPLPLATSPSSLLAPPLPGLDF